jgi:hypothetical protein
MANVSGTYSPALTTLVARLRDGELFSELAASLAGGPVTCGSLRREVAGRLSRREHCALQTSRDSQYLAVRRAGYLVAESGAAVARVGAVYLPARIPDQDVCRALWEGDVPLGVALAPLGVTRLSLRAWVNGDGLVRSAGLLLLDGVPVALAEEELLAVL